MSAIEFDGATVHLGESTVLRDVTLSLDARTTAVIGDNGSGKTTLARVVAGLTPPTAGKVRVLGLDPAQLRRRVAVVFSNPDAQIIMPTVAEDVAFSLRSQRLTREDRAARVANALERFGLIDLADRSSHELSGGQKQLLALCGAFIREPDLVVADEPTAYLDARNARRVSQHLLDDGAHRLLLVTHDLALAVLIAGGHVAASGDPGTVVRAYEQSLTW
jgi:biotin transport system ATP-binding protein